MKALYTTLLLILNYSLCFCNGLAITNTSYNSESNTLTFTISWDNAWKVPTTGSNTSSDGAWVFVKYAPNGGSVWQHLDITNATSPTANFNAVIGNNGHGVMLIPDYCLGNNNCSVSSSVTLHLDNIIGTNPDFKIFGIEMVKVPSDDFYLGDGYSDRCYYTYPDTAQAYHVTSSAAISAGTVNGSINKKDFNLTEDIPADYPKGYREFWVMKYKVSMEQYVAFLNTLDRVAQNNRTKTDISTNTITNRYVMTETSFLSQRNPIRCDENLPSGPVEFYCDLDGDDVKNEENDGLNLIACHLSKEDFAAYLDWAAMRPFSNMELEKLCRGPLNPVAGEYAWGSSTYTEVTSTNIVDAGQDSESFDIVGSGPIWPDFYATNFTGGRCGFAATPSSTRLTSGATFYGIMDVQSSGIFYITETNDNLDFHYFNDQGDGQLTSTGDANSFSSIKFGISPSYFKDPISDGNSFTLSIGSRASYGSGQGAVTLFP